MYSDFEIHEVPLSYAPARNKVKEFLGSSDLRVDNMDYYAVISPMGGDDILAAGGLLGDTIRCVAVRPDCRDEHLANRLVSHLMMMVGRRGYPTVKVITKPQNLDIFQSMAFELIGRSDRAVFLESNKEPLSRYCHYLQSLRHEGRCGAIVINANPFTKGHRYLIETAAKQVDHLFVIPVKEDRSVFSYVERKKMIELGTDDLKNVTVCKGSAYTVSSSTFPSYFIKSLSDVTDSQIQLDLDIFTHYIAPALNVSVRFVGSEPTDPLTNRYNELMARLLPPRGIQLNVIERVGQDGSAVSASRVRAALKNHSLSEAAALVVDSTVPFLISRLATCALQDELDTTPKPGLVDRDNCGAHKDMDHTLMTRSIQALHPFFNRFAEMAWSGTMPNMDSLREVGREAERAMLKTTNGVNTHRGALFCMGLAIAATAFLAKSEGVENISGRKLSDVIASLASHVPPAQRTHGGYVCRNTSARGARSVAMGGYSDLFESWLPFLRQHRNDPYCYQKTLLKIISTLDDTNVIYRANVETAREVKLQASRLLQNFTLRGLRLLDEQFTRQWISPGGSADMFSLTIFFDAVLPTAASATT
ncbi:MAG: [citrate (pro-3S)-lyase] ligase [Bacteroidales bacterium]|nr:[citrate (pro-3S)-lyase] ligase [Bacteroidales bacterium]